MSYKKPEKTLDLWNKAKKIIPGGSQLLSKRAEMFLPDQWPAYYKSAKGAEVTDLDGNTYLDHYYWNYSTTTGKYRNRFLGEDRKETEAKIKDAIKHLMSSRTTLVIAHRLSTLENADRIMVLKDGHLVESGTHDELISRDSEYNNLFRNQIHL